MRVEACSLLTQSAQPRYFKERMRTGATAAVPRGHSISKVPHTLRTIMRFLFLLSVSSFVFAADSRRDYPGEEQPVYSPMKVSAAIALGLYSISTLIHWFRFFTLGQHPFMLTLTIGMTAMAGGFGLRLALELAGNRYSSGAAPMAFLILLSPYLFLALDYALLSRLAATFDEVVATRCLLVRRTRIVPIFICSDIATFILQATGGVLGTASTQTQLVDIGHKLSLVGLCLQLISFLFFTFILIIFGWRLSHEFPTHKEQHLRILSRDPI
ncbi:hypothetical protein C8J57DRAFT_722609 [Mycena rebaudengoi]|nr:hypothetical protein C8J57DRAFT_722609 [Mycena rebaudengoi]